MSLTNGELSELFARAASEQEGHRRRALQRASRAAFHWPEEARDLAGDGRSLEELRGVGPWVARVILGWLEDPPDQGEREPPGIRRDFLTRAEARATIAGNPEWRRSLRADLQMHTTYSDGKASLREMVAEAETHGYEYVAVTDHSKELAIARGMDEERLADEVRDIDTLNEELAEGGRRIRVLRSLEMNLSPAGEGDMDPEALARLDLVLGAFHSQLRVTEDQTDRYLAALRNPDIHVVAHPRGRRYDVRLGLLADWPRVFDAAAATGKALEIDGFPDRQDLNVELLEVAVDFDLRISIGTDAHRPAELRNMEFGLAAAIRAGIPRERILNFLPREELLAWASDVRARAHR